MGAAVKCERCGREFKSRVGLGWHIRWAYLQRANYERYPHQEKRCPPLKPLKAARIQDRWVWLDAGVLE